MPKALVFSSKFIPSAKRKAKMFSSTEPRVKPWPTVRRKDVCQYLLAALEQATELADGFMKVDVTVLQQLKMSTVAREFNMKKASFSTRLQRGGKYRWPHRALKRLKTLEVRRCKKRLVDYMDSAEQREMEAIYARKCYMVLKRANWQQLVEEMNKKVLESIMQAAFGEGALSQALACDEGRCSLSTMAFAMAPYFSSSAAVMTNGPCTSISERCLFKAGCVSMSNG
jgi:hypothetical protein